MPDDTELAMLLADAGPSPEGDAVEAEQSELLQGAVLRIPVALRLVLVLHDMEELTTEEVGQVLGLQPGTVRVRLHRARLAVRKELSRRLQGHPKAPSGPHKRPRKAVRIDPSVRKRPEACRDLFAQLSEYLDGRVEPSTCDEMQRHIDSCPACVAFLHDLRSAIDRCRAVQVRCDEAVAKRLRAVLTREYVRLITAPPRRRR